MSRAQRSRVRAVDQHRAATVTVTCLHDGWAHRVTDVELADALSRRGGGHYQALCGHHVVVGSMVDPDGRPCPLCSEMCRAS